MALFAGFPAGAPGSVFMNDTCASPWRVNRYKLITPYLLRNPANEGVGGWTLLSIHISIGTYQDRIRSLTQYSPAHRANLFSP